MKNGVKIMGILNLTPDSFSDGGEFSAPELAKKRIDQMILQGADIIDIGGESTGPGSESISADEELARLRPIIDWVSQNPDLVGRKDIVFSIDTYKASVATYALKHGFSMVNDVTALRGDPKMIEVLVKYKPFVVLMYSKDPSPRTTHDKVVYEDVVATIKDFLTEQTSELLEAGFPQKRIIIDPGMGAFISAIPDYSFEVIEKLGELKKLGYPILVGISRKSCLGVKMEDRDGPSVDWSLKAIMNGASIIRIHNVELMKKACYDAGLI
jgi:dihydropteroate synthase